MLGRKFGDRIKKLKIEEKTSKLTGNFNADVL